MMLDRFTLIWALVLLGVATALCFVPLLNLLAFEFAFALALPVALCAGALGVRAVRAAPDAAPWRGWLRAGLRGTALAVLPLLPITLNTVRVRNCDYLEGVAFYLVFPLASVWIAAAWGMVAGRLARRRGVWLFTAGLLGTVAVGLARFWVDPPVDVFNPFLGYYPGSIYDEELHLGARLLWSRAEDLALAVAALGLLGAALQPRRARVLVAAATVALATGAHLLARAQDVHRDAAHVQAALGGLTETEHFRIHHPASWSAADVQLLALDLEFAWSELHAFFEVAPAVPIDAYLYPDVATKKRLMGAARTRIAKPWQRAFHVHGPRVGDAVTIHELAHVFSAEIADAPHHLSLRGALPNMGLIEGLAVAATWEGDRLDPHQWSAAMRRIGVAPSLSALLRPDGFLAKNSRAAYTLCGSFMRFYRDLHGQPAMAEAYRTGQFAAVAADFEETVAAWERFLDTQPVSEAALAHARARYDRPAIFGKVCAHEIAALRGRVDRAIGARRLDEALDVNARILRHVPRDVDARLQRVALLLALDRGDEARVAAEAVRDDEKAGAVARARAREWLADLEAAAGQRDAAREDYEALLAQAFDRDDARRLAVKRAALSAGAAGEAAFVLLTRPAARGGAQSGAPDAEAEAAAVQALDPAWSIGHYLAGRQRLAKRRHAEGRADLQAALAAGLPHPALTFEAERLIAASLFDEGRYPAAAAAYEALGARADLEIERGEAEVLRTWARRARFFAHAGLTGSQALHKMPRSSAGDRPE